MKNYQFKIVLVIVLLLINVLVSAQNLSVSKKAEVIKIENDTLFTSDISVEIKPDAENGVFPIFYDEELEKVSNIKVYEKKGNRYKLIKDPVFRDENVSNELISSQKLKSVFYPSETDVKIDYTVTCNELKYFSDLPFFSYYDCDTFDYQITIPESYRLVYDIIYRDSLTSLVIDSMCHENQTQWHFKAAPLKVDPDPFMFFGIYKDIRMPLMRTTVIPAGNDVNATDYFNNWYLHKAETSRGLDTNAKKKIDEVTEGLTDSMEMISVLYNYVRNNFKYVAIEIGMGAFIPSHTNEVFVKKQGDCKDLSNFLSEALNYKGIKSNIALASTFNHICDCNFPSICSADHVVCVAYLNGKPIILDPTDPVHIPNTPVQGIQERTILIISPEGGEFYKLKRFDAPKNLISYEVAMEVNSENSTMQGAFEVDYSGISGNFLRRMHQEAGEREKKEFNQRFYESVFNNHTIKELTVGNSADTVSVDGLLLVNMKIFNDQERRYLFLDFLPRLIETEERETLLEGTYLGSTLDKKVRLTIKMDASFEAFKPIKHSFKENGVSLDITILNPTESIIECRYELLLDHILVNKENQEAINGILKSFKKITNEPVVLKNKN